MANGRKIIATCLSAMMLSQLLYAAEVKLDISANRTSIYIGESVLLTVKASGADSPNAVPDLSAITNCAIKLLGSHSDSRFSIVISNGIVKREGFSGRVYSYEITPSSTGTLKAGPVSLTIGGKTFIADGPLIQVTGVEKQEWVSTGIKASRESVLVGETFDITLSIMLKRLPGQFADIDPLDPGDPPTVSVPFLETAPIAGLEMPDIGQILNSHLVHRNDAPGFAINNYSLRNNPFDLNGMFNFGGMMQERKAKFIFDKSMTARDGNSYFEYTLKLSYTPKEEGSHTFGPAIFKGSVITGVDQASSRAIKGPVFAVGPAITVRVIPPPDEGRPSSYIGAIGSNINAEAGLDAQTCKVGDPLRLTLAISGNINIENINPPPLNMQANLTRNFKIYEDTIQTSTKEGKKTFAYTVRPTTSGTIEFPPIEVSYFDAASRSYRTVKTLPIPVRANESTEIGVANIIGADTNRTTEARKASWRDAVLVAPVDMNQAGEEPSDFALLKWQKTLLLAGPLIYLLVSAGVFTRKHIKSNQEPRRRRQAVNEAIASLRQLSKATGAGRESSGNTLCSAIRKYIANRFGSTESGMTPSDARKVLDGGQVDPDISKNLCEILERNFNSIYSSVRPDSGNFSRDCSAALQLVERIESTPVSAKNKQGFNNTSLLLLMSIVMILCLSSYSAFAGNPVEFQFLWNEANSKMASASSPDDFLAAAAVYQKLADTGVRNGPVFYNMGTAFIMAGKYDKAIHALLRAERYSGSNEDIRHNMLLAIQRKDKNPNASLPWYRVPLFWHYQLSTSARIAIAVFAFTGFWLALTLRVLGAKAVYKPILSVAIITFIVIGSSVATSIQQEDKDLRSSFRIIIDQDNPTQTGNNAKTNSPPVLRKGRSK